VEKELTLRVAAGGAGATAKARPVPGKSAAALAVLGEMLGVR